MKKNGFTLVEILVAMAIIAIIGVIFVTIFANTLRGSNKSQVLAVLKQNGQAILENISKDIRNADSVICPKIIPPATSASSDTLVIIKNGLYTGFKIVAPSAGANGLIQQDSPVQPTPPAAGSDIKLFIDNICTDVWDPLATNSLTDTNPQSGVSVSSGSFTRSQQAGYRDSVTVSFTLSPGVLAPSIISSQIDPVVFQTTIGLR